MNSFAKCLFVVLMLAAVSAQAVIETYQFDNKDLQLRYQRFTQELRCPKCQNQNLSGSNSPIAEDLRRELHRLLHEGYSDQEISDFMVARYGEFVLYRPPMQKETYALWFAPLVFLLIGFAVIAIVLWTRRQPAALISQRDDSSLTTAEQQKLDAMINKVSKSESDND